jgi:hypothetical protein
MEVGDPAAVHEAAADQPGFKVDHDRSIAAPFQPTPVVDGHNPWRRLDVLDGGMSPEVPKHRVVALRQPKLHENSLRRPPACGMTDEPRQFRDPAGSAGVRWNNTMKWLDKAFPRAKRVPASPVAQFDVQYDRTALNGQIL